MSNASSHTADKLIQDLSGLEGVYRTELKGLTREQDIRAAQARFLGKKGQVSALMKEMGALSADERPRVGEVANRV